MTDAAIDDDRVRRKERAAFEWVALSNLGNGYLFNVVKGQYAIKYDEHGNPIAWADEDDSRGFASAQKKADAFAKKMNQDPELAADLLSFTYEKDIYKSNPEPVSKRNKRLDANWVSQGERNTYRFVDSNNSFRKLLLTVFICRNDGNGFNLKIRSGDSVVFDADNIDAEKKNSVLDFIANTCEVLNLAKVKTMKKGNEIVRQELAKLGLH
jgi:hypothetical protein